MIRNALLLVFLFHCAAPAAFADSSKALRDIALTSMAVRRSQTAAVRRAALDNSFDATSLELRDSLGDAAVRGKDGSQRRKNWFAQASWYAPQPRRPYRMPALAAAPNNPGLLAQMGISFQTALTPWKQLLAAASQGSWAGVAIVQTLAG